jgi:hypothetical protein
MSRLFLLLLLVVDWAASPEQLAPGVELEGQPWASSECFCYSLVQRPTQAHHLQTLVPTLPVPVFPLQPDSPQPDSPQADIAPSVTSLQTLLCIWQI